MRTKLFVILFFCIVQFSEEKPTADPQDATTTGSTSEDDSSTVTTKPGDEADDETVSSTEEAVRKGNSSEENEPPKDIQLPVDLLSDDILLDPSVVLARAEREVGYGDFSETDSLGLDRFEDGIPTVYFLEFIRPPRSLDPRFLLGENRDFRVPEEPERRRSRFSRSSSDDLDGAEDGFIIRPYFKYRHEQSKRSNRRQNRDRETYRYYPRYPVFPGK